MTRRRRSEHTALALVYPAIVAIGFALSFFQSKLQNSYFASKRNFFNVYFVKWGWGWTTLVYAAFAATVICIRRNRLDRGLALSAVIRLAFASLYWYVLTQWLFGPSALDRIFVATGGSCAYPGPDGSFSHLVISQVCKRQGGFWQGGHDVSGHCLLLTHSSLFLMEEFVRGIGYHNINTANARRRTWNNLTALQKSSTLSLLALMILWIWMLLMTAIYYHGWIELISGTFIGMFFWAIQYYLNTRVDEEAKLAHLD